MNLRRQAQPEGKKRDALEMLWRNVPMRYQCPNNLGSSGILVESKGLRRVEE